MNNPLPWSFPFRQLPDQVPVSVVSKGFGSIQNEQSGLFFALIHFSAEKVKSVLKERKRVEIERKNNNVLIYINHSYRKGTDNEKNILYVIKNDFNGPLLEYNLILNLQHKLLLV